MKRENFILAMVTAIDSQPQTNRDKKVLDNKTKTAMSYYYSNFNVDGYHLGIAKDVVTNVDEDQATVDVSENDLKTFRNDERSKNIKTFMSKYKNPAIILVLGQSNIANHGDKNYHYEDPNVYTYFNKDIRIAKSQGSEYGKNKHLASGNAGNFLPKLGTELIKSSNYDGVIFVNIAIGGTYVKDWVLNRGYVERKDSVDNYEYRTGYIERIKEAVKYQDYIGKKYTHIIWQQGESDNVAKTGYTTYLDAMKFLSHSMKLSGITTKHIYVAVASYFKGTYGGGVINAQIDLPKRYPNDFKAGPDLDKYLKAEYRLSDDVHLNSKGLDKAAFLWANKLKNN